MKLFLTSIFVALTLSCSAQTVEVAYSPISVKGWGRLPETTKYSIGFAYQLASIGNVKYVPSIRYTHVNSKSRVLDKLGDPVKGTFNMFFVVPAGFNFKVGPLVFLSRLGAGVSDHIFPNKNGLRMNFLLEAGISYPMCRYFSIALRYSHISNGFRGRTNPGLDNVVLSTAIHF